MNRKFCRHLSPFECIRERHSLDIIHYHHLQFAVQYCICASANGPVVTKFRGEASVCHHLVHVVAISHNKLDHDVLWTLLIGFGKVRNTGIGNVQWPLVAKLNFVNAFGEQRGKIGDGEQELRGCEAALCCFHTTDVGVRWTG